MLVLKLLLGLLLFNRRANFKPVQLHFGGVLFLAQVVGICFSRRLQHHFLFLKLKLRLLNLEVLLNFLGLQLQATLLELQLLLLHHHQRVLGLLLGLLLLCLLLVNLQRLLRGLRLWAGWSTRTTDTPHCGQVTVPRD